MLHTTKNNLPLVASLLALIPLVAGADTSLGCFSSVDSVSSSSDSWMTPSLCSSTCSDYAYIALKNGGNCYCLSDMPSDSVSSSYCNVACYGYGLETCGGASYYQVYQGAGTVGASSSAADSDSTSTEASDSTSTSSSSATSSDDSTSSSSTQSSTLATSTVSASSSDITSSSETSSATSSSAETSSSSKSSSTASSTASTGTSKKSTNVGAIAGGVVGGIAAIAIIAVIVFFVLRNRNSDDDDDDEGFNYDTKKSSGISRGPSKNKPNPLDMPMVNPFTHPSDSVAGIGPVAQARNPSGGLADPRLNPVMMGRRRLSEGSLADEADYSRKILQVANPDH